MDGRTFVKLCRDGKLLGKQFTATDADLVFAKSKQKGSKTLGLAEFEQALQQIADKKQTSLQQLLAQLAAAGGPVYTGTRALANKFHDDKSLYTGVHAHGGPSTKDDKVNDLSSLLDRSPADVRGTKM
ncbi:p25-alpha domain-containing protein, putative [Eimeria tenella]|uniref:p25-alpha domain-containing protein, putative n=1 Tax=Eimeria tenella TaxID=5802 RepID=U6KZ84_EIMTE|nr:p25-alpha domain-containing protein, putative [Eimeria tenella]CDJ40820.1 p25-alpha domain-containing protein, putative [Eimeria tenella]|eukprot:XP_013231570.1 p25-alpha domain-containing protein, putative [Eimeria tenella]